MILIGKMMRPGANTDERKPHVDDEYVPAWDTHTFSKNRPNGDWVGVPKFAAQSNISGTDTYQAAANKFFRDAKASDRQGRYYGIELKRDPSNQFDQNAIEVFGHLSANDPAARQLIGYVDRSVAAHLANTYSKDMPVAAEIVEAGTKGKHVFFKIRVLVPPAKERKKFELNGA